MSVSASSALPRATSAVTAPIPLPHPVCFVCPTLSESELRAAEAFGAQDLSGAAFLRAIERGRLAFTWLVQTYLQLKFRGQPVRLSRAFPEDDAICVYLSPVAARWASHASQRAGLVLAATTSLRHEHSGYAGFRVAVCADRPPAESAHVCLFQNALAAKQHGGLWVPHWPQPGLVPRADARGARLENVAFIGLSHNLDQEFLSPSFAALLHEHGFRFALRDNECWSDYRELDAVLAVRNRTVPPCMLALKPASKLVNAWRAGVPALLGPEPAYRALRASGLDYMEVTNAREALSALQVLRADPGQFLARQRRGFARAAALSPAHTARAWEQLLSGPIYAAHQRWVRTRTARLSRALTYHTRLARELTGALRFWRRYVREQSALGAGASSGARISA